MLTQIVPSEVGSGVSSSPAASDAYNATHIPLWFEVDGQSATLDDIVKQVKEETVTPPPKPAPRIKQSLGAPPRIGVEDSGNWSFVIAPRPSRDVKAVGWRVADVIYETSSGFNSAHSLFSFM